MERLTKKIFADGIIGLKNILDIEEINWSDADGKNKESTYCGKAIDRLTRERDAAIEDLNGGQACFSCKHFRRNGGECFGAGICRVDGVKIFPCDEPYMYRVEIPNDGRDVYEWRGLTRNDEKEEEK